MKEHSDPQQQVETESLQPRKLNWTKVLFDYHICLDAEAFEKWDGDLTMNCQEILEKDIPRTRSEDPLMKKQSFRQVLRRITTFYCKQNGVTYQQGLLEVVYPFALLRNKDFKTKKVYAYFNAFMRKHFPKVLVQRVVEGKKQLPHAILAITLTEVLLRFHYPALAHCFRENQMPMSLIVTQELLTIFAKNLPIRLVYEIYDYYIQKNDQNYIFYLAVALIGQHQPQLLQSCQSNSLHTQIQRLKSFTSPAQLQKWFSLTQKIAKETPPSFLLLVNDFCFSNRNLLSTEDVDRMLKSQENVANGYLSVGIEDIDRDVLRYVLVVVGGVGGLGLGDKGRKGKYQVVRVGAGKGNQEAMLGEDKIYVLVARQENLQQQLQILTNFAQKLTNYKFLILKQHLVEQKTKKCLIF